MRLTISNPINRDFGMVPRGLWAAPLPFAAKGVAAYLFCLPDGAVPYVAEIEAALGLGRDARRKAFAALVAAGVVRWVTHRDARGKVIGKTLALHPETLHAPEKPAGGKSASSEVEIHPCRDGISGDTKREKEKEGQRATQHRKMRPIRPMGGTVQASVAPLVLSPDDWRRWQTEALPGETRAEWVARTAPMPIVERINRKGVRQ